MGNDAIRAREFVVAADLPPEPGGELLATDNNQPIFDAAKAQATVVGADVISFVKGVTPEARQDIVNASLLAQLVAKKKTPDPDSLQELGDWYNTYFDALTHIGFVIQDMSFARYREGDENYSAHEAILEIGTALLGGSPAALALFKTTVTALQKASGNESWITLFDRESRTTRNGRFQISLVEKTDDDQLMLSLMAFALEAKHTLTQVLLFKIRSNDLTLEYNSSKVTINADVLAAVRGAIATKLATYASAYITALPDL
jgi:hypothetical protein